MTTADLTEDEVYRVVTGSFAGALVRFHFVNSAGNADCRFAETFGPYQEGWIVVFPASSLEPKDDGVMDKIGCRGPTIVLRSGKYFDFLDPDPATIDIDDVAWGLAYTCRFGGQSLAYYSVAQHSVLVSRIVPPEHQFAALMHDAAEAFTGDIPKPLKLLLPDFALVEKRVEAAVAERFGFQLPLHPDIKAADLRLLRTEQRDLTAGSGDLWTGLEAYEPLPDVIVPETPEAAAVAFLARFRYLLKSHTNPSPIL